VESQTPVLLHPSQESVSHHSTDIVSLIFVMQEASKSRERRKASKSTTYSQPDTAKIDIDDWKSEESVTRPLNNPQVGVFPSSSIDGTRSPHLFHPVERVSETVRIRTPTRQTEDTREGEGDASYDDPSRTTRSMSPCRSSPLGLTCLV
jgi:hypothetical protein